MGRAPYKTAKEGGGRSLKCFRTTKEHSCHVYTNWMPTKQISGQTLTHIGTTNHQQLRSQIMTADNTLNGTYHAKINSTQKWSPRPILVAKNAPPRPLLVAKNGPFFPKLVLVGPNLVTKVSLGDHFSQPKVVPWTRLGCYEWSCFLMLTAEKAMQAMYMKQKQKGHSYMCLWRVYS